MINIANQTVVTSPFHSLAPCAQKAHSKGHTGCVRSTLPRMEEDLNSFPEFDLTGQVALVTGAARGLGNAISLALAHAGADVALGLRDVNALGSLPAQIV